MSEDPGPPKANDIADLRSQIDQVERRVLRRIDPGVSAMVVAVAVLVLIVAGILPWVSGTPGWQVVFGVAEPVRIDVLPRVFGTIVFVFGLLGSVASLVTRRWVVAWVCVIGCGVSCPLGLVSIWSQQSSPSHASGPGPGIGLVLTVLTMIVLAVTWGRQVWSRPGGVLGSRAGD